MPVLSTEFPVRADLSKADFVAQAVSWLKGMESSSLFRGEFRLDDLSDEVRATANSGESFIIKEQILQDGFVVGARHLISDEDGRLWQSEFILTSKAGRAALRSRNQCLSVIDGAKVAVPRKPYFLTMVFDDGWPTNDGSLDVTEEPKHLSEADIETASQIIRGEADSSLPIVYMSRDGANKTLIEGQTLARLARQLSGFAHCVIEPSKNFSVKLRSKTSGMNPYGGSIAVCVPIYGAVKRFYINSIDLSQKDISSRLYNFVTSYVINRRNDYAWEWQDLVESSASALREKAKRGEFEIEEWIKSRDEEIAETELTIRDLRSKIDTLQQSSLGAAKDNEGLLTKDFIEALGAELYDGEFVDRMRISFEHLISSFHINLDGRTIRFIETFMKVTNWSGGANRLKARLSQAGRDHTNADRRLGDILMELGFSKRLSGGHPVYLPGSLYGVDQQTLSCSPSDPRSGKNAAAQIIRDLGLQPMKE